MADTVADVQVPQATWVDLYDETSITAGTAVDIINKGSFPCVIVVSATEPEDTTAGFPLYVGPVGSFCTVSSGESGLWAYAVDGATHLSVQET